MKLLHKLEYQNGKLIIDGMTLKGVERFEIASEDHRIATLTISIVVDTALAEKGGNHDQGRDD